MTSTMISAMSGMILFAGAAAAAEPGSVGPMAAFVQDIGGKQVVGYYLAENSACDPTSAGRPCAARSRLMSQRTWLLSLYTSVDDGVVAPAETGCSAAAPTTTSRPASSVAAARRTTGVSAM